MDRYVQVSLVYYFICLSDYRTVRILFAASRSRKESRCPRCRRATMEPCQMIAFIV